jgi:hypothetical protein
VFTLGAGALLTLFTGTAFSLSFVFSGLWLDPLVPASACAAGVMVSFAWALISRGRHNRRFRLAYGPFVSRSCLRSVIRAGRPHPSQTHTVLSAVVAIKKTGSAAGGDSQAPFAWSVLVFQEKVSELFKKAGGTIIGTEGDLVTACFGSPLERVYLRGKKKASVYEGNINARTTPAALAVDFVSEIAEKPECSAWNFGLDMGACAFAWTALSGYFALGGPVQRARILSRLAARYNARVVISASVNEALPDLAVRKLDVLKEKGGSEGEPFYRLAVRG